MIVQLHLKLDRLDCLEENLRKVDEETEVLVDLADLDQLNTLLFLESLL